MSKLFALPQNHYAIDNAYFSAIDHIFSLDGRNEYNPFLTSGRGNSLKKSTCSAYGEYQERMSLLSPSGESGFIASVDQKWAPFVDRDFNCTQNCVWATHINSGENRAIPRDLVYFRQNPDLPSSFPTIDTTGCAFHTDIKKAMRGGIFELIEKNSLILAWINRQTFGMKKVDDIYYFDISFFPPFRSILAIKLKTGQHAYAVGAACHKNVDSAMAIAREELVQLEQAHQQLEVFGATMSEESYGQHYLNRNNTIDFATDWGFLFAETNSINTDEGDYNLFRAFCEKIGDLYLYIYPRREKNYTTIRAISPDLLWSLIPLNEPLAYNRPAFLEKVSNPEKLKSIQPVPFP